MTSLRSLTSALLAAALLALAGCGGGGQQTAPEVAQAPPARIEIAPSTVLLTAPGARKSLSAKVFDAAGNPLTIAVEWTSSHPAQVTVDAAGVVTAAGTGGSSQVTARIGTLASPPLLVVHTTVPAGTVLVNDANISGDPVETNPDAPPGVGNTYVVRLVDMAAPRVGDLLMNTEGKVVAGRVTAVETVGGVHTVTLRLPPAREMFPNLAIDEVIDLNGAEVVIPAEIQAQYDIRREGNTFTFTPKPGLVSLTASALLKPLAKSSGRETAQASLSESDEFKLGPFKCKGVIDGAAGAGSGPVALTLPPLFTVALNQRLDILSTPANGLERFVLHSEPSVSIEAGLKSLLAFEGKVTCETELFAIKIPIGGPVALIIGGQLPVGVGVELGGKITLANAGLTVKGTAKTTGDVGLACPAGTGCAIVHEFGPLDITATLTPDVAAFSDLRLEPTLSAYAFIKASIGNPFLNSLRFDAFKVKAGLAFKGNFAPQLVQLADAAYQSDYKLVSELKAGVDTGFTGLAGLLGLNAFAETLLEVSVDVANSPVGTLSADKAQYDFGEAMSFKVKFDPGKINFLGLYNVQRVVLLKNGIEVGSITPNSDQAEFDFNLVATTNSRANEFSAFVVTSLLPLDLLSLELGQATAPAVTQKLLFRGVLNGVNLPLIGEIGGSTGIAVSEDSVRGLFGSGARGSLLSPGGDAVLFNKQSTSTTPDQFLGQELFIFNAQNGVTTQLTQNFKINNPAAWSPTQGAIVYNAFDLGGSRNAEIRSRDLATGADRLLFPLSRVDGDNPTLHVAWSPDGSSIAVLVRRSFEQRVNKSASEVDVFIVRPDGTDLRLPLTADMAFSPTADWSPDSRHLVLPVTVRRPDNILLGQGIVMLDTQTGTTRVLTQIPSDLGATATGFFFDEQPKFSPDGSRVAYVRRFNGFPAPARDDGVGLRVVRVDGEADRRVQERSESLLGWDIDGFSLIGNGALTDGGALSVLIMPLAGPSREAMGLPANFGIALQRPR